MRDVDREIERAFLSLAMTRPDVTAAGEAVLSQADFESDVNGWWFAQIKQARVDGCEADLIYLRDRLEQANGRVPNGVTIERISAAFNGHTGTTGNVAWYVERIREKSRQRSLQKDLRQLGDAVEDSGSESVTAVLERYARRLRELQETAVGRNVAAIDLSTVLTEPMPTVPWLIPGWLAKGEICLLAGEWGSGKSLVALDLALALTGPGTFLGYTQALSQQRVLYVDEENGQILARRRIRQLLNGRDISAEQAREMPLRYLSKGRLGFRNERGRAAFLTEVDRFEPNLIVLDSAVRFFPGDNENDNAQWSEFMDTHIFPLAAQGVGWLLIDHMGKPSKDRQDPGHRVRGASDKPGSVDELWCLMGERGQDTRTLSHEKGRYGALHPSLAMRWVVSDDDEAATITATEERLGVEQIVTRRLDMSGANGLCAQDLIEATEGAGYSSRAGKAMLSRLHGKGNLKKLREAGRNVRYWLTTHAPPTAE